MLTLRFGVGGGDDTGCVVTTDCCSVLSPGAVPVVAVDVGCDIFLFD